MWRLGDHYAVRDGDWKLVQFLDVPPMLFDLAADPGERHDLAAEKAKKLARAAGDLPDLERADGEAAVDHPR